MSARWLARGVQVRAVPLAEVPRAASMPVSSQRVAIEPPSKVVHCTGTSRTSNLPRSCGTASRNDDEWDGARRA